MKLEQCVRRLKGGLRRLRNAEEGADRAAFACPDLDVPRAQIPARERHQMLHGRVFAMVMLTLMLPGASSWI